MPSPDNVARNVACFSARLLWHIYCGFRGSLDWILGYARCLVRLEQLAASFTGEPRPALGCVAKPAASSSRSEDVRSILWRLRNLRLCLGFRSDRYTSRFSFYMDATIRRRRMPQPTCENIRPEWETDHGRLFSVLARYAYTSRLVLISLFTAQATISVPIVSKHLQRLVIYQRLR